MVDWKRNLVFVWLSQFMSIAGFCFCIPFQEYYMQQEFGVSREEVLVLAAVANCVAPLSLAIFTPLWGIIADKYGRKIMLVRANIGSVVLLTLLGLVNSATLYIALRMLQGVLTGTVTAAQTMVSAHTPRHRSGFALGALGSALFLGAAAGSYCGGQFTKHYGYSNAFFVGAMILLGSIPFVVFGTTEKFVRPERDKNGSAREPRGGLTKLMFLLPMIAVMGIVAFSGEFDRAYLPLLIQEIFERLHGTMDGVSVIRGEIFAITCLLGGISAMVLGHLADRVRPMAIARIALPMCALLMIPQAVATSFTVLYVSRAVLAVCVCCLPVVFQSWIAKNTSPEEQGFVFGWVGSIRALGWAIAPVISGFVATGVGWHIDASFGIRAVFFASSAVFVLSWPITEIMVERSMKYRKPQACKDLLP